MNAVVEKALSFWGFESAQYSLVAARENAVYRVTTDGQSYALRLHRKGYRSDPELWSELAWMGAVARGGIKVPAPIASTSGEMLHVVNGVQVDVLTWLSGKTLTDALPNATSPERKAIFHEIGRQMAKLHTVSDAWTVPPSFTRCAWNRDGLLGNAPLWGRFWTNPALNENDRALLTQFREAADAKIACSGDTLDYGLIHADLVSGNMMICGGELQFIDFDDGGFGFRLFDIATALCKHQFAPDYQRLQGALLEGYTSIRPIALDQLDLFMAIRAGTYVGWNISRMEEEGAIARNERFITTALHLASNYLK